MTIPKACVFMCILLTLTTSKIDSVDANGAMPLRIWSLTQDGHDVKITVEEPSGPPHTITLTRQQWRRNATVVSGVRIFDGEGASDEKVVCEPNFAFDWSEFCDLHPDHCWKCGEEESGRCIGTSCNDCAELTEFSSPTDVDDFCTTFPEYTVDCDDDGEAECCGECNIHYYYDFRDTCVPAGETEYVLTDNFEPSGFEDNISLATISVEHVAGRCGCSVSEPGAHRCESHSWVGLIFLMFS